MTRREVVEEAAAHMLRSIVEKHSHDRHSPDDEMTMADCGVAYMALSECCRVHQVEFPSCEIVEQAR